MKGEEQGKKVFWVEKVLLSFRLSSTGVGDVEEFEFVQSMGVADAVSAVDRALRCVCLGSELAQDVDRTFDSAKSLRSSHVKLLEYYHCMDISSWIFLTLRNKFIVIVEI